MRSICLMVYRVSLSLWLGACLFFVTVTLKPVQLPEFETSVRQRFALRVFPGYYKFGLILLAVALLTGGISAWGCPVTNVKRRLQVAMICTVAAVACVLGDLQFIYPHLSEMMNEAISTGVMDSRFRPYHLQSMTVNSVMTALTFVGALLANWPALGESATRS